MNRVWCWSSSLLCCSCAGCGPAAGRVGHAVCRGGVASRTCCQPSRIGGLLGTHSIVCCVCCCCSLLFCCCCSLLVCCFFCSFFILLLLYCSSFFFFVVLLRLDVFCSCVHVQIFIFCPDSRSVLCSQSNMFFDIGNV